MSVAEYGPFLRFTDWHDCIFYIDYYLLSFTYIVPPDVSVQLMTRPSHTYF